MNEKQHKVESDKYSRVKELGAYRVVIRGEIPMEIRERLSAIHAKAILKTVNETISDSNKLARMPASKS